MDATATSLAFCIFARLIFSGSTQPVSRTLTDGEIAEAEEVARNVRFMREEEATGWAERKLALSEQEQWYDQIKFGAGSRYNAVGALLLIPPLRKYTKTHTVTRPGYSGTSTSQVVELEDRITMCTAFYVAPDILATAAHCLRKHRVTHDSNHVMIFRQQYDAKTAYSKAKADQFERVIVDWVYMGGFDDGGATLLSVKDVAELKAKRDKLLKEELEKGKLNGGKVNLEQAEEIANEILAKSEQIMPSTASNYHKYGLDFAFLRTSAEMDGTGFYTPAMPETYIPQKRATKIDKMKLGKIKKVTVEKLEKATDSIEEATIPVVTVGYPLDAAEYFEPVSVKCSLVRLDGKLARNDAGLKRKLEDDPKFLNQVMGNQYACISAKAAIGNGGSGGPWFLDENDQLVVEEQDPGKKTTKRMSYVGITSWGPSRKAAYMRAAWGTDQYKKQFLSEQQFVKANLTPVIGPHYLFLYDRIKDTKRGTSLLKTLQDGMKNLPPPTLATAT